MGMVYEALDIATGARVAVKLITAEGAQSDVLLERFKREAKACEAAPSKHIVRVLAAEREDISGLPYMVMDYLEGEDLETLVGRLGPLPPDLALRVAAQACEGLIVASAGASFTATSSRRTCFSPGRGRSASSKSSISASRR
jgi:serine/threonine protein kinase